MIPNGLVIGIPLQKHIVSRKVIFINVHFFYYNLTAQVWLSVGGCLEIFQMLKISQVSRKVTFHVHIDAAATRSKRFSFTTLTCIFT
jgi:hypothetical protein